MRFFNIDLHVSVIADVQAIFAELGHIVDDWCLSGHHWVLGKERREVPLLGDWTTLRPEVCDAFYETYRDELDPYDGFVCCYPAAFALLYERWQKPTIVVNCVRYETPFTARPEDWRQFDEFIRRRVAEGRLLWVCNNRGDAWCVNHFTGIQPRFIPSLCDYVGLSWTGTNPQFLLYGRTTSRIPGVAEDLYVHSDSLALKGPDWRYTWEDLYRYRGIIHFPYHNGSMSINEHYAAGAPLFFPSRRFLKELHHEGRINVLSELTFHRVHGLEEPTEPGDPNNLSDPDVLESWLGTADFYDETNLRHLQYFDSYTDLERLLRTVDVREISRQMAAHHALRKQRVHAEWRGVLEEVEAGLA